LQKARAACRKHKSKLIIAKLDRLSRNLNFITSVMESGVEFVAVDNPHANKLTIHILAAVAEHEREAISERTKAALAAAKRRGVKLGGPRLADARRRSIAARGEIADVFAANVRPIIKEIQASGVTACAASPARSLPVASKLPVVVRLVRRTGRSDPAALGSPVGGFSKLQHVLTGRRAAGSQRPPAGVTAPAIFLLLSLQPH